MAINVISISFLIRTRSTQYIIDLMAKIEMFPFVYLIIHACMKDAAG